jgi:secondary thiamine-phosphate synthase enzyme
MNSSMELMSVLCPWLDIGLKTVSREVRIATSVRTTLIDITHEVEETVEQSKIENGFCLIQSLHSTTAILVNEHEDGLLTDILNKLKKEFPEDAGWRHNQIDDNADAHLASVFLGSSTILAVKEGRLLRGTWQRIFLLELDGPRSRRVVVAILGE